MAQYKRVQISKPSSQILLCSYCHGLWTASNIPGWFCAFSMPCEHLYCTDCTMLYLYRRERCLVQSCRQEIPAPRQQLIATHHREYATWEALRTWEIGTERLAFQEPLSKVSTDEDAFRATIESVACYLRTHTGIKTFGTRLLIDLTLLDPQLVAFANLLPPYRAAEGKPFTSQQKQHWPYIVAALRMFLEAQASQSSEVEDTLLLSVMQTNICKALRIDIEQSGFTRPGTTANGAFRALLAFTVTVCRVAYEEKHRGGTGFAFRHLRLGSGSRPLTPTTRKASNSS